MRRRSTPEVDAPLLQRVLGRPIAVSTLASTAITIGTLVGLWWAFAGHFQTADDAAGHARKDRVARLWLQWDAADLRSQINIVAGRVCRVRKMDPETCNEFDHLAQQAEARKAEMQRQIADATREPQ